MKSSGLLNTLVIKRQLTGGWRRVAYWTVIQGGLPEKKVEWLTEWWFKAAYWRKKSSGLMNGDSRRLTGGWSRVARWMVIQGGLPENEVKWLTKWWFKAAYRRMKSNCEKASMMTPRRVETAPCTTGANIVSRASTVRRRRSPRLPTKHCTVEKKYCCYKAKRIKEQWKTGNCSASHF